MSVSQTETQTLGFLSAANEAPSSGENFWLKASSGQMVKQLTEAFLVGGLNPGRANIAAAPQTTVDQPGFEPPT